MDLAFLLFLGGMLALITLAVEVVHSFLRGDVYRKSALFALIVFATVLAFFGHFIRQF